MKTREKKRTRSCLRLAFGISHANAKRKHLLLFFSIFLLPGCTWDGNFTFLGYTTAPNYDCNIRTVYVPIFENVTFRRNLEFDLTRAVVREIEAKTPYRIARCREQADTELIGKIVAQRKALINQNQLGEVREAETAIGVELVWRDLRPGHMGEILSKPDPKSPDAKASPSPSASEGHPPVQIPLPTQPVLVQPVATFIPELGGSRTSAEKQLVDRIAVQIVSMMERPW